MKVTVESSISNMFEVGDTVIGKLNKDLVVVIVGDALGDKPTQFRGMELTPNYGILNSWDKIEFELFHGEITLKQ